MNGVEGKWREERSGCWIGVVLGHGKLAFYNEGEKGWLKRKTEKGAIEKSLNVKNGNWYYNL